MRETQLLKGVLDGCVLQIIAKEDIYGYELVQRLKAAGFTNIVAGTVYPLLQKLEKKEMITSCMKPSPDGPPRKYFQITVKGEAYLADFWDEWHGLVNKVSNLEEDRTNAKYS
ncbi:PadR family transcriptional regulator [Streptococcus gallolyticus subsp. gallolyticus]|uniref:Putative transcriptional regulator, PadR family n=1 Tax=Streptococcus gallolyticus TaxID=315405 RepID=A0A060RKK8_9STRE|nr:PadR family transcriptional regulator [Streptococcus gallolyticus]MCY7201649.1 PadR family transcriptional regulator [Streptococcus gallolyticus subsp. gallolyticus]CDO18137.1 Putative transcriptional regulator, PadR family [Streptococcus gallolyticus]SDJ95811.1 transcriptional regulator, PadR family [Streptococcus gallolyticus]SDL45637.1 transcriptional regulator, PadR family [Streptococcus gallolyticus]